VAEAHDGLLQCLSGWDPATGRLTNTLQHFLDHRGLHWVPALNRLTSRTWGGPISAVTLGGAPVQLASNPTQSRPGDEQSQPAVDPDGASYWIRNGAVAERRRLSDHGLLISFPVTSTGGINTIAVSNEWVFVLDGAGVNGYSKATGRLAGRQPLPFAHPCNNFGFGASLNADRFMYLSDCRHVQIVMATVTFAEPEPTFSVTDLGTLGGAGNSEALTLNDNGRIVGVSNNAGFYMDASASAPSAVQNPFGDISWAYGVTGAGLIAATNPYSGYLWNPATGTITGPPPGPFTQNNRRMVMGVNASGTKVLACADNGSFAQNYVWDVGTATTRLIPGAYNFCHGRISGDAVVVNADPGAGNRAFLWNDAIEQEILLPVSSIGWDVNESYTVVGSIEMQTGHRNAFRHTPGNMQTLSLGTLGGTTSEARGINTAGVIVGWSLNAAGQRRGFIWDPTEQRMYELPPLPGHTESQANDINGNGVIVGYSSVGGVKRAVRWTSQ
jgi:probable HAF family extracellular repeat protein